MEKTKNSSERGNRRHSAEFKIEIAERMLAGENVKALSKQYRLARSMMYRWRDAFRERGVWRAYRHRRDGHRAGGAGRRSRAKAAKRSCSTGSPSWSARSAGKPWRTIF